MDIYLDKISVLQLRADRGLPGLLMGEVAWLMALQISSLEAPL